MDNIPIEIIAWHYMTDEETRVVGELGINFLPDLKNLTGDNETISSATFKIFDEENTEVTDDMTEGAVDISGTNVTRKVIGSGGTIGREYFIEITATKSGGGIVQNFLGLRITEPNFKQ